MYQLICMSFDGDYVTERFEFNSIDGAWEYANDLGSKWYFYPFHFVIEGETIKDTPTHLEFFKNKSINEVKKIFNQLSEKKDLHGADIDTFMFALIDHQLNKGN